MNIMKLDLMKNTPKVFDSLIEEEAEDRKQADRSLSKFPVNQAESQDARQSTFRDTRNRNDVNPILEGLGFIDDDNPLPSGKAPKDLKTKADETILKAISLKLDLNKISTFKPKMNKRGGRILNPDSDDDRSFGEIRAQEVYR